MTEKQKRIADLRVLIIESRDDPSTESQLKRAEYEDELAELESEGHTHAQ